MDQVSFQPDHSLKFIHSINVIERKLVTVSFVGGRACFLLFCEEPRSNCQMMFERTPDIPAIAGDGLAYGVPVACMQILDTSVEV